MLIFLEEGGGKGGWHLVMSLWLSEQSGRADPGEMQLNLLGLLLHLPVNEHCCWRYPCVPCHEAHRQHLHLTLWPQRKMAAAVTDVFTVLGREPREIGTVRGPRYIAGNNCYDMCLSSVYIQHGLKPRRQLFCLEQYQNDKSGDRLNTDHSTVTCNKTSLSDYFYPNWWKKNPKQFGYI